jgi:thiamine-monophosphate kinase
MKPSSRTLADLGEARFLQRLRRVIDPPRAGIVGIGDDAAVFPVSKGSVLLTTDTMVDGTHFLRHWFRPEEVGHKALAVNLSDAAAMGGGPQFALVSLILPGEMPVHAIERFYRGMRRLARRVEVAIVGGNVAEGPVLSITVSLLGTFPHGDPVLRSRASPGDHVFVTGQPGWARLGHRLLDRGLGRRPSSTGRSRLRRPDLWRERRSTAVAWRRELARSSPGATSALRRFLAPEARLAVARGLHLYRPTAMVDVSDGLGRDLFHLAEGEKGIVIDRNRIPLSAGFKRLAEALGEDPEETALSGGEDYELLVTLPPETAERLGSRAVLSGTPLTEIGIVSTDRGVWHHRGDTPRRLSPSGFQHFRSLRSP